MKNHPWQKALGSVLLLLSGITLLYASNTLAPRFAAAKPVWLQGRETEKNLSVGFRAVFQAPAGQKVFLRAAGSTLYRVFLNGRFLGHGPARGPHGFYRVDEWDLTGRLKPDANLIAFEVAGYNANSYYVLDQPSFLQAEVISEGKVLASTGEGEHAFAAIPLPERRQKVQRYSFQRPFTEVYRLSPGYDSWRQSITATFQKANCTEQPGKELLPRRVAFADFTLRQPSWHVSDGKVRTGLSVEKPWKDRSLTNIGAKLGGYPESELETIQTLELQTIGNSGNSPVNRPYSPERTIPLKANDYTILDFGKNLTGFLGTRIECRSRTRLFLVFDEILTQGDVNFRRLGCANILSYDLQPGSYEVESFEPYTLRYLKLISVAGDCSIHGAWLREFADSSSKEAYFAAGDERFNRLFEAGRETFRQNSIDIFMDCPSRERAGWLCDSFFTARTAFDLSGDTRIEHCFLENYLLPARFSFLPEGMLPMCYPADHNDGVFIPNWSLWFVVQLEEYLARSGDRELVAALKPRVLKLFDYFRRFHNTDGLLEKLESWVFVEWSKANDFVQDVNYPSNMLYARALSAAGRMYDQPEFVRRAAAIQEVIRHQSFDGEFFVDNAVRKEGKLAITRNRTEVCQYFAFYFDVATPQSHPKLWQTLISGFGPQRRQTKAFPEVHPANAFIGNVLRLELLSRYGLCRQLLDESLGYQFYMVEQTGTLWENDSTVASCNHGFASHGGVHVLYRDVLGLYRVNTVDKKILLRFTDFPLHWCEGRMPTPDGPIELNWHKDGNRLLYRVAAPAGYTIAVENRSALEAVRRP